VTDGPAPEPVTVRPAEPDDLPAVADLRWRWITENTDANTDKDVDTGTGTETDTAPTAEHDDFVRHFIDWAAKNTPSHRCLVLVQAGTVIGMAWLAILPRVPSPHALHRASGDLQCVYVVPEARNTGLGGRLLEATLAEARSLGLERVTVHSSPRAVPAYTRNGFEPSPRLLHAHVARTTSYP